MRKLLSFVIIIGILISLFGALRNFVRYFENDAADESKREQAIEIFDGTIPDGINVPDGESVVYYGSVDAFLDGGGDKYVTESMKKTVTTDTGETVTYINFSFGDNFYFDLGFDTIVGDTYTVRLLVFDTYVPDNNVTLIEDDGIFFDVSFVEETEHFGGDTADICFDFVPTVSGSNMLFFTTSEQSLSVVGVLVTKAP